MSGAITRCTFALSASAFSASEPSSAEEASSLSDMAGLGTLLETNRNCAACATCYSTSDERRRKKRRL